MYILPAVIVPNAVAVAHDHDAVTAAVIALVKHRFGIRCDIHRRFLAVDHLFAAIGIRIG
jgi:hypothetical protein